MVVVATYKGLLWMMLAVVGVCSVIVIYRELYILPPDPPITNSNIHTDFAASTFPRASSGSVSQQHIGNKNNKNQEEKKAEEETWEELKRDFELLKKLSSRETIQLFNQLRQSEPLPNRPQQQPPQQLIPEELEGMQKPTQEEQPQPQQPQQMQQQPQQQPPIPEELEQTPPQLEQQQQPQEQPTEHIPSIEETKEDIKEVKKDIEEKEETEDNDTEQEKEEQKEEKEEKEEEKEKEEENEEEEEDKKEEDKKEKDEYQDSGIPWSSDPQLESLGDDPEYFGESPPPIITHKCYKSSREVICDGDAMIERSVVLEYPPWVIKMPNFVSREDKNWFVERAFGSGNFQKLGFNAGDERKCPKELYACRHFFEDTFPPEKHVVIWYYPFTQGKQAILGNVTYKGKGQCRRWYDPPAKDFFTRVNKVPVQQEMAMLLTEEGDSFQHFLDTTLMKLSNGWDIIDPAKHPSMKLLVLGSRKWPMVNEILMRLGFTPQQLSVERTAVAREMVWPCNSPLRHPFLWQRIRRMLSIPHDVPGANKIVYFTRSVGSNFNPGRRVRNEEELLKNISQWLKDEGRKEELVVFDHRKNEGLTKHMEFFKQARVLIGPHGGAFYNLLFVPSRTLVVEFFPDNRFDQHVALASFWILTRLIDGKYYLFPRPTLPNSGHDMLIDVPKVMDVLKKELNN